MTTKRDIERRVESIETDDGAADHGPWIAYAPHAEYGEDGLMQVPETEPQYVDSDGHALDRDDMEHVVMVLPGEPEEYDPDRD